MEADGIHFRDSSTLALAYAIISLGSSAVLLPFAITLFYLHRQGVVDRRAQLSICFICFYQAIFSCLLFFAGALAKTERPRSLCVVQAALIYPRPIVEVLAVFALVFQVWTAIVSANVLASEKLFAVILVPYVVQVAISVPGLIIGLRNPEDIDRGMLYCIIDLGVFDLVTYVISMVVILIILIMQIQIVIALLRYEGSFTSRGSPSWGFSARVAVLGICLIIVVGMSVASVIKPKSALADFAIALAPFAVVGVLLAPKECLAVWRTCGRRERAAQPQGLSSAPKTNHDHRSIERARVPSEEFHGAGDIVMVDRTRNQEEQLVNGSEGDDVSGFDDTDKRSDTSNSFRKADYRLPSETCSSLSLSSRLSFGHPESTHDHPRVHPPHPTLPDTLHTHPLPVRSNFRPISTGRYSSG